MTHAGLVLVRESKAGLDLCRITMKFHGVVMDIRKGIDPDYLYEPVRNQSIAPRYSTQTRMGLHCAGYTGNGRIIPH